MKKTSAIFLLCSSLAALSFGTLRADDKKPAEKTPLDQSNRPEDLKITQAIRKAVMADDSLSMAAMNVQIITAEGKVTLLGKVNSADEKKRISAHAKKSSGTADVVNKIEIKATDKPKEQ